MINTTLTDPGLSASEKELSSVSAGMQFPPAIEDDDQLRVYDPRTLKVMTYNHDESMTLGSDDLALESYVATNHGDSIGFAYNSYVYSKPYGCYNCYQIESEKRDVRIDGVMYESPTEDP